MRGALGGGAGTGTGTAAGSSRNNSTHTDHFDNGLGYRIGCAVAKMRGAGAKAVAGGTATATTAGGQAGRLANRRGRPRGEVGSLEHAMEWMGWDGQVGMGLRHG